MSSLGRAKQERVIEAVRLGLEGDAAVAFVHSAGFKMNAAGIARNLKSMGGRGKVAALLQEGKSNIEILDHCFPNDEIIASLPQQQPNQSDLFNDAPPSSIVPFGHVVPAQFETTKLTLVLPNDLYEALRAASRAENKSRNDLIVEILTAALARMPVLPEDFD